MTGYINQTSLREYRLNKQHGCPHPTAPGESRHKTAVYRLGLYLCDRTWFSGAEGGQWYTFGELVGESPRVFTDLDAARDYSNRLGERVDRLYNDPQGSRAELSSVSCEGRYVVQIWEDNLPQSFPQEQPHYE